MNEYANSEAVTYAVRQAENESAKRRKMQAVNPYDGEEVDDSKDKMKMFRMRKSEDRPMYEYCPSPRDEKMADFTVSGRNYYFFF